MRYVTLCSGGLDSVVLAHYLKALNQDQILLFVDYEQSPLKEFESAALCSRWLEGPLEIVTISGADIFRTKGDVMPNRNAVFANLAAALAVSSGCDGIALAVHGGDHEVYPDCRPEFINSLQSLFIMQELDLEVGAPFVTWPKSDIVILGDSMGVPFSKTWSCCHSRTRHCGTCRPCLARKNAFEQARVGDPTYYEHEN